MTTAPDARALAHEIMNKGYVRCRADTGLPVAEEVKHSALCDVIQSALRAARNDALEEAARCRGNILCESGTKQEVYEPADIQRLRSDLATAERLLKLIRHWANSKCPCENETPDPCPLCGSSVAEGGCKALEETLPRNIADPMSDFLARDKDRP